MSTATANPAPSPAIDEDFTTPTYTWQFAGSGLSITNGELTWSGVSNGQDRRAYTTIPSGALNDENWLMRFEFDPSQATIPSQYIMQVTDTLGSQTQSQVHLVICSLR